jgi:uncharacterized protein YbaR (Trm112 family)
MRFGRFIGDSNDKTISFVVQSRLSYQGNEMPITHLLELLVCPKCKGSLTHDEPKNRLICSPCNLIYSIQNGIPIMVAADAARL